MFAVVRFTEKERSLKGFFTKLKVKSERVDLPSKGCFFIITAEKRKNKVPLDKIIRIAGALRHSLIFPSDFTSEGTEKTSVFDPRGLKEKLLFSIAAENLRQMKLKPADCSICINDNSGTYIKDIERLLPLAAKIYVVCSDAGIYEEEAKRLFYEYGCSVMLREKFEPFLRNCDMIISYKSEEVPSFYGKHIFTENIFSSVRIILPVEYEILCPEGIDKEVFACALYEKCNVPPEIFLLDNITCKDIY